MVVLLEFSLRLVNFSQHFGQTFSLHLQGEWGGLRWMAKWAEEENILRYVERFKKRSAYQLTTVLIGQNSLQPFCTKTRPFVPINSPSTWTAFSNPADGHSGLLRKVETNLDLEPRPLPACRTDALKTCKFITFWKSARLVHRRSENPHFYLSPL